MNAPTPFNLPRGAGTALFPGRGAWLPRGAGHAADPAVLLSQPESILTATRPEEIPALLERVEAAQLNGRYVAGYLSYEAGAAFGLTVRQGPATPLPAGALACDSVPLAWMAVYPPESVTLVPAGEWSQFLDDLDVSAVAARVAALKLQLNVSKEEYTSAIARVREYIAAGDTYQVNYTVRARYDLGGGAGAAGAQSLGRAATPGAAGAQSLGRAATPGATGRGEAAAGAEPGAPGAAPVTLDPLDYFLALVVRQTVPYAAYLDLGDTQILSLSPELYLRRDGEVLEARPMKGTRPRSLDHQVDVALAYEQAETEKERAENLMILDMVRNDLGRVSRTGTIHVPALFTVEPYRTVWQMTSTVQGLLQPGTSLAQIMKAVFPGASITGAPKHHTMEIINEVETEPRGAYCGTVALFSPGGDFTGNIGIRTITHRDGRCVFGVGSGVVWDAKAVAEYEETLQKGAFALAPPDGHWRPPRPSEQAGFHLFETLLLAAGSTYTFLEEHLERLAASAEALSFPFERQAAGHTLAALAAEHAGRTEPLVVRMGLDPAGTVELSVREAPLRPDGPVSLLVSPFRMDHDDPLLHHKTTRRGFYDREHQRALAAECFDALFLNRLDRVTEGGITSIFARFGTTWVTPPLSDGLLPGIWRAAFMAEKGAAEQSLTLDRLAAADEIVVGNSVRGAVRVSALLADPVTY